MYLLYIYIGEIHYLITIKNMVDKLKLLISSNNGDLDIIICDYLLKSILSITLMILMFESLCES